MAVKSKIMKYNAFLKYLLMGLYSVSLTSCVTFAPPSPMLTYGGPKTTIKRTSNAAVALGTGVALFKEGHAGGQGWFGQYKYGLNDKWDIGVDAIGFSHSDQYTFSAKIATRYQFNSNFRLEGGIGAADDSDGKSLNSDFGLTWGTDLIEKSWNYYASLRIGYARGFAGNSFAQGDTPSTDTIAPPDAIIALLNLGT